jgi:hypothetical protein
MKQARRKGGKVPVSERALVQRINRKLADKQWQMKVLAEDSRWSRDLGRYFVLDKATNSITARRCDIEAWANDLGVMKPYEELRD